MVGGDFRRVVFGHQRRADRFVQKTQVEVGVPTAAAIQAQLVLRKDQLRLTADRFPVVVSLIQRQNG